MVNKKLILWVAILLVVVNIALAAKGCCETTNSGENCLYTDENDCAEGSKFLPTTCDQTSYCKLGCCYSSDEGRCFKNTPRTSCNAAGAKWVPDQQCEIEQCEKGCCIMGDQAFFVTEVKCKQVTSNYPNLEMYFDDSIKSEQECIAKAKGEEQGCCVTEDGCVFTTRANCNVEQNVKTENKTTGFYKDMLCSNDELHCGCAKQQTTGCVGEDLYWFDSCGNRENIYDSNKKRSYNNGYVLKEDESCKAGPNDKNCGNCEYLEGTVCGLDKDKVMPIGKYTCIDINCKETYKDDVSPNANGKEKMNGESWCVYDGLPGRARDLVGSRHYRHICINGEEVVEPCKDFREEICVQGVVGKEDFETVEAMQSLFSDEDYIEASCRDNSYKSCFNCNTLLQDEEEDTGLTETIIEKRKTCCERSGDCYWLPAVLKGSKQGLDGTCVPEVPPGLKFWGDTPQGYKQTSTAASTKPKTAADSACSKMEDLGSCTVVYQISGLARLGEFGKVLSYLGGMWYNVKGWHPVSNKECLSKEWVKAGNDICRSLGDCGAYMNIRGKITKEGYYNSLVDEDKFNVKGKKFRLRDSDIASPEKLVKGVGVKGEAPDFWDRGGTEFLITSVALSAASGLLAGFSGLGKDGPGFWKSAGKGVIPFSGITDYASDKAVEGGLFGFGKEWVGNLGAGVQTYLWIRSALQLANLMLTKTQEVTYQISCEPWQPPLDSEDCETCNEPMKPCSEYKCKSLGANCMLINKGSGNETCVSANVNDVTSPIIKPDSDILTPPYTLEEVTEGGNPGYIIKENIPAFTPVTVGIKLDEPATCKYDVKPGTDYDNMPAKFGSTQLLYKQSATFSLTSELAEENVTKVNNGEYSFYIRCVDANNNKNMRDYFIKFKVDPAPDLTPPEILFSSIEDNSYIAYNTESVPLSIYVNEYADCKWSRRDTDFELMENEFRCSQSAFAQNSIYAGTFECKTTLTNLTSRTNVFFIRCKDKPLADDKDRNVMSESVKLTLKGTKPLNISSTEPSGKLYKNDVTMKVVTVKGAENGKANCAFSSEDVDYSSMILFDVTGDTVHEQKFLDMPTGDYKYYVKCMDAGGNLDEALIEFEVAVDTEAPLIEEVYVDCMLGLVHVKLNEESSCEYSTDPTFAYGEGTPTGTNTTVHEVYPFSPGTTYYMKCVDRYSNQASYEIYVDEGVC